MDGKSKGQQMPAGAAMAPRQGETSRSKMKNAAATRTQMNGQQRLKMGKAQGDGKSGGGKNKKKS